MNRSEFNPKLKILQPDHGFRFSVDSLILAHFVLKRITRSKKILEIGSGCGIISLILAAFEKEKSLFGVEIEKNLFLSSVENKKMNYKALKSQVTFIHGDIKTFKKVFFSLKFDTIFSNPPFFPKNIGRHNPNFEDNIARREILLNLSQIFECSKNLLKSKGNLILLYPVSRIAETLRKSKNYDFHLKALTFIHPFSNSNATHFIAEFVRGQKTIPEVLTPYIIYKSQNEYREWILKFIRIIK